MVEHLLITYLKYSLTCWHHALCRTHPDILGDDFNMAFKVLCFLRTDLGKYI